MHRVRASIHTGQSSAARWQAERRVVAVCPEVAGGLPTPRPPAEI
ncbi:2-thiouracil desulfurase family protein, partial [Bordetella pertussis]